MILSMHTRDNLTDPALSAFHAGNLIVVGRGKMRAIVLYFGRLLRDAEILSCIILQKNSVGVIAEHQEDVAVIYNERRSVQCTRKKSTNSHLPREIVMGRSTLFLHSIILTSNGCWSQSKSPPSKR